VERSSDEAICDDVSQRGFRPIDELMWKSLETTYERASSFIASFHDTIAVTSETVNISKSGANNFVVASPI
jgi:hypothetical protein